MIRSNCVRRFTWGTSEQLALPVLKEAIYDLIGVAQLLHQQVLQVALQPGALRRAQPPAQPH